MKLIVGLGNPGKKYEKTRHNLGFVVLDALVQEWNMDWKPDKKTESLRALKIAEGTEVIFAKPMTFMNASGMVVSKMANLYHIEPAEIWIVHDDLDLPLGKIKIRKGGSSAGHKGVESIIKELGSDDFVRFRLGIGHPGPGSSDKEVEGYVLSPFRQQELDEARRMVEQTVEAIKLALEEGLEKTMSRFN